jgi:Domain of unknown function (DUF5666)
MTGTTAQRPSGDGATELPRPRRGSRWRWSRPHRALAAGGALAAVLGLGVATGGAAGAATTTSGNSGAAVHGRPPGGMGLPTVAGKITALSGADITVATNSSTSVTVVTTSSTTYKSNPGPGGGTTSSASALKVGAYVGVTGTKNSDGTVTATNVMIGRPSRMGQGGPGGGKGRSGKPPSGGSAGAPGA